MLYCMQHWCQFLVYLGGLWSGSLPPYLFCTGIGKRYNTCLASRSSPNLPLSTELPKPSFSWLAPLYVYTHSAALLSFNTCYSSQLAPAAVVRITCWVFPYCQRLPALETWVQLVQVFLHKEWGKHPKQSLNMKMSVLWTEHLHFGYVYVCMSICVIYL